MKDINIFKAELQRRQATIEAMVILLDANRPDLLSPLWEDLSEWVAHIEEGLESATIQFTL